MERLRQLKRDLCNSVIFKLQGHPPDQVFVSYDNSKSRVLVECRACGQRRTYTDSGRVIQIVQIEFESCDQGMIRNVMSS